MFWKPIAGVALIATSIGAHSYAEGWFRTAGPIAVNEPISFVPGHISASFLAGYNARYRAGIDFAAPQELRFQKPDCIPFPNHPPEDCGGIPTNLNASWTLSCGEEMIKRGSADTTIWRLSGGPFLTFGSFNLEGGRRYKLDAEIMNGGTQLSRAQPQLTVYVFEPEFGKTFGLSTKTLLIKLLSRAGYGLTALIGLALAFSGLVRRNKESRNL